MTSPEQDTEYDIEELRDWAAKPQGQPFWREIKRMANSRMEGIRSALMAGNDNQAKILAGELNMAEEILQLVDIMAEEDNEK